MKTFLFSLVFLLAVASIGNAQTEKGRLTVGAQIGSFSYQNQNGGRNISVSISPSAGYFIADGLVIGTGIPLSIVNGKNTDDNSYYSYKNKSSTIGLAPFIRYFVGKNKLKPYLSVAYSYSKLTLSNTSNSQNGPSSYDGKGKITSFVPTIGLAYFISQNLGLTIGLNYNINHQDQEINYTFSGNPPSTTVNNSDTKSVSLGVGFQLFIGK